MPYTDPTDVKRRTKNRPTLSSKALPDLLVGDDPTAACMLSQTHQTHCEMGSLAATPGWTVRGAIWDSHSERFSRR